MEVPIAGSKGAEGELIRASPLGQEGESIGDPVAMNREIQKLNFRNQ